MTRVAFVTNLNAPYRVPLWSALAKIWNLQVLLLDGSVSLDAKAHRGADWNYRLDGRENYVVKCLRRVRVARGEGRYYLLPRVPGGIESLHALILGGWESPAYWQLRWAARRAGVSVVGFYESHDKSSEFGLGAVASVRARWFRRLDAVVVPGVASHDTVARMGVDARRIFTGFNSVDVLKLRRDVAATRVESAGHRFLYIGQLVSRKNVSGLLSAFASIRRSGDSLTIVGTGEQSDSLIEQARRLELLQHVHFAGPVPYSRIPDYLASADTLVLPSLNEVWGLVVNEALAAGLHAVVTRNCGVAASVDGMSGVFVTGSTEAEIAQAMSNSRNAWKGLIESPAILAHTPERFAEVFGRAVEYAVHHKGPS